MRDRVIRRWAHALAGVVCATSLVGCADAAPEGSPPPAATAVASDGAPASDAAATTRAFLSMLDDSQRSDAVSGFDDAARTTWHYVPQSRTGIPLDDLDDAQRAAVFDVVGTGLSARGTALARGIVDLESILQRLEFAAFNPMAIRRDDGLYFLQTFGTPGDARPWGWSFEGHHLSVNVTHVGPDAQIVAPLFMGANPARVPDGPQAGLRLLGAEEDLGFELLHTLDAGQRTRAVIAARTFGDIVSRADPVVEPMAFAGLPASEMTPAQQQRLRRLIELHAGRMADAAAAAQLQRIDAAGFGKLHFAWAGSPQPGAPHYYRIHGPTVLIEYDNSQQDANHIHTIWRDLENDFGGDLLRRHYSAQPGSGPAHSHE